MVQKYLKKDQCDVNHWQGFKRVLRTVRPPATLLAILGAEKISAPPPGANIFVFLPTVRMEPLRNALQGSLARVHLINNRKLLSNISVLSE